MRWPCLISEHVPRPPRGLLPLSNQFHDQMLGQITSELLSLLAPMKSWWAEQGSRSSKGLIWTASWFAWMLHKNKGGNKQMAVATAPRFAYASAQ